MSSNEELSLEQRLVLQLSAAMNQEEEASREEQHPPATETATYPELPDTTTHHLDTGDDQINIAEISNLLNSIGPLGGISSQPAAVSTLPQLPQPHVPLPQLPAPPQSQLHHQPPLPQSSTSDDSSQNITADALISSLLGGPNSGGLNLANINLNNINLKDISLETLNSISNTLGSSAARYSSAIGNFHLDGLDLPPLDSIGHSVTGDHYRSNNGLRSEESSSHYSSGPVQNNLNSLTSHESLSSSSTGYSRDRLREPLFSTTSIDPEVSTIQSVLQSLLTGDTSVDLLGGASTSASSEAAAPAGPSGPTASNFSLENADNSQSGGVDFSLLSSLGLGSEDQNLIESLRSAIDGTSSMVSDTASKPSEQSYLEQARMPLPGPPKPKRSRASTSRTSAFSEPSSVSKYHYQSDFNASDPDTLRAIQQALLSALGPSASSTSLAETITQAASERESDSAAHAGFERSLESSESQSHVASAVESAASTPHQGETQEGLSPTSALAASSPASKPSDAHSTHPLVRISKQRGVNKKKLREENAARKRKWREVNLMQNKDNDLRIRIVKRAGELYGEKDTPEKSKWIEEEFTRRRQKRILRAGINSIVESAKARAAKAAEESGNHGSSGATTSSIGYGRFSLENQARTLSQQSKQAAKTHLSQLFRNSNAVLEPQLHSDKLPIPLAPYMLVPSPRRPPYRIIKDQPGAPDVKAGSRKDNVLSDGAHAKTMENNEGVSNKTPSETDKGEAKERPAVSSKDPEETSRQTSKESQESPKEPSLEPVEVTKKPPSGSLKDVEESTKDIEEPPKDADEPPKDTKESPKGTEEPPKDAKEPPQDAKEPPQDAKEQPEDAQEPPQDTEESPKGSKESPKDQEEPSTLPIERPVSDEANKNSPKDESKEQRDEPTEPSGDAPNEPTLTSSGNSADENPTSEADTNYSAFSDRPKHRYTLIGGLKLGVPPNLPAIYRQFCNAMRP